MAPEPLGPAADRTAVVVVPYDTAWPHMFDALALEIRARLGEQARAVLHIGSTSVPGLAAKPVIDIVLLVDDASAESTYVDALVGAGFRFVVREPEWHQHRLLKRDDPSVNLHVYSIGCEEVDRVVRFRDWLRTHDDDRQLYERVKWELASRSWDHVQDYADAKNDVVAEIMARASERA